MAWFTQDINGQWWQLDIDGNGQLVTTQVPAPGAPTGFYAAQTKTGQELVKIVKDKLAGYGNAANPQTILMHLNEAKDEVWAVIKSLNDQNFVTFTQDQNNGLENYFPQLVAGTREYNLPSDLKEVKLIEVISPTDQADTKFIYRKMNHPDFTSARRSANMDPTTDVVSDYYYTIAGTNPAQFVMANYPALTMSIRMWYVRGIPDFTLTSLVNDIVAPYDRKMTDFAVKRVLLGSDLQSFEAWKAEWRDSLIMIAESSAPRNQADAVFVQDFEG